MYIPEHFQVEDQTELFGLMRQNSFATLITSGTSLAASHLPFHIDESAGAFGTLRSHLARANPQWKEFSAAQEALVIFQGPHAYVSPSLYVSPNLVPTWNYVVVHAYGYPEIVGDDELLETLRLTAADNENTREQPWTLEDLPLDLTLKMLRAIVGFKITITRLEGKYKMSQNRSQADQLSLIDGLTQSGGELEGESARWMKANIPK
ncbi:MAG: FMN-binding negative transcriptional regulator [Janthinobacterium lividum]